MFVNALNCESTILVNSFYASICKYWSIEWFLFVFCIESIYEFEYMCSNIFIIWYVSNSNYYVIILCEFTIYVCLLDYNFLWTKMKMCLLGEWNSFTRNECVSIE